MSDNFYELTATESSELLERLEKLEGLTEKNMEIGYANIKTLMFARFDDQNKRIESLENKLKGYQFTVNRRLDKK